MSNLLDEGHDKGKDAAPALNEPQLAERLGFLERLERTQARRAGLTLLIGCGLIFSLLLAPFLVGAERWIRWGGTALTGYDVQVEGGGSISFFPSLKLSAEDVVFSLPRDRFQPLSIPPVARIARVEMEVSRLALLTGQVHLSRLNVIRPQVRLDRDTNGQRNWSLNDTPLLMEGGAGQSGTASWLNGEVAELTIVGGTVRYTDTRLDEDILLSGIGVDGGIEPLDASGLSVFRLRGDGQTGGEPFYLEGELERLENVASGKRVPFGLQVVAGSGRGVARGSLAFRQGLVATADVSLEHDDLRLLLPWLDVAQGPVSRGSKEHSQRQTAEPLQMNAVMDLRPDVLEVKQLQVVAGGSDVAGSVRISWERSPRIEAVLSSKLLYLKHATDLGQAIGIVPPSVETSGQTGVIRFGGEVRLGWQALSLGFIETGQGTAAFSWTAGKPNLAGVIRQVALFDGQLDGEGTLTTSEGRTAVQGDINLDGVALGRFVQDAARNQGIEGRLSASASILGVGSSIQELLQASAGTATVAVRSGTLYGSRFVEAVSLGRSLPFDRLTADIRLGGGVARTDNLVIEGITDPVKGRFKWDLLAGDLETDIASGSLLDRRNIRLSGRFGDVMFAR